MESTGPLSRRHRRQPRPGPQPRRRAARARRRQGVRRSPANPAPCAQDARVVRRGARPHRRRVDRAAAARAGDATLLINNAWTAAFAGPLDADPDAVRARWRSTTTGLRDDPRVRPGARRAAVAHSSTCSRCCRSPARRRWPATRRPRRRRTRSPRRCGPCSAAAASRSTASTPPASTPTWWPASTRPRRRPTGRRGRSSTASAAGEEDIFPDPNALAMAEMWFGPKAFERAFAAAASPLGERLTPLRSRGAGRWRARASCEPRRRRAGSRARPRPRRPRCSNT